MSGFDYGKMQATASRLLDRFAQGVVIPFLGIAVADPGQPADIYAQYANVAIMKKGVIVVVASEAVAYGDPVYYTPATGVLSKTSSSNTLIAGAIWETARDSNNLAAVRLNTP